MLRRVNLVGASAPDLKLAAERFNVHSFVIYILLILEILVECFYIHKDSFACLFSIHNIISLSCHEQVSLSGMINLLYYEGHLYFENVQNLM